MRPQSVSWSNKEILRITIFIILAVSLVFYTEMGLTLFYFRLLPQIHGFSSNTFFYIVALVLLVIFHILVLIALSVIYKKNPRPIFIFWGITLIGILAAGGARRSFAFLVIVFFAYCLTEIGRAFTKSIFRQEYDSLGFSLGFGILLTSLIGAYLALFHVLQVWIVLLIFLFLTIASLIRNGSFVISQFRSAKDQIFENWNMVTAFVLESFIIVAAYVLIDSSTPETTSDAIRLYGAYVKLLAFHKGFFVNPDQWSFVIPQAGLSYASVIFVGLGSLAVQWSMALCWIAAFLIVVRGRCDSNFSIKAAVALILLSCPMLLLTSTSLMPDMFLYLWVLLLAIACIEGDANSSKFWFVIGFLLGAGWTSKFSAPIYAFPLTCYAIYRAKKGSRDYKIFAASTLAVLGVLVAVFPWFINTYQQTGNPFFPIFNTLFPAKGWTNPTDLLNLSKFQFNSGILSWIVWPIDLTFHTDKFVDGYPGILGLVLVFLLVTAIPLYFKLNSANKALVIAGIVGTGILWTRTIYVRYWIPGLCLITLAAVPAMIVLLGKSQKWKTAFCILLMLISFSQLSCEMLRFFSPYYFYLGLISRGKYFENLYPGYLALESTLTKLNELYPRIWITDYDAAGQLDVEPMDAAIWIPQRRGYKEPRRCIEYWLTKGCKYWVVNKDGPQAKWIQLLGLSPFVWPKKNEIVAEGSVAMYKLSAVQEALKAFDDRLQPGTDLLLSDKFQSNDFPKSKHWTLTGSSMWTESAKVKDDAEGFVKIPSKSGILQVIPLPPKLKNVVVTAQTKMASAANQSTYIIGIVWKDENDKVLENSEKEFSTTATWSQQRFEVSVPERAIWAVFSVSHGRGNTEIFSNELHMYSK